MQRPAILAAVCLTLAGSFAGCSSSSPDRSGTPPGGTRGVLLITVDGLIPSEISTYGGDRPTPALDDLAAAGRAWTDAWTADPMSRPGAATYLTGLAPDRHRVRDDEFAPLPEDVPTLAGALRAAGWETAAFPDSSFVGYTSGLLNDFAVVAEPPSVGTLPVRWFPNLRRPEEVAGDVESWLASLPEGARWFAWVHLSAPLQNQLYELAIEPPHRKAKAPHGDLPLADYPSAVSNVDGAVARLMKAIDARGDLTASAVFVAGTSADVRGGEGIATGAGMSLDDRAVRVPLIARLPGGAAPGREAGQPVWAPDVPMTIVELTGIEPPEAAEGLSLTAPAATDRIRFAFSWATRDQMGWLPLRRAADGDASLIEGVGAAGRSGPQAAIARLGEALGAREILPPPIVPLDDVLPLLKRRGVQPHPLPVAGREVDDAGHRAEASHLMWQGRATLMGGGFQPGYDTYDKLEALEPDALAVWLDRGRFAFQRRVGYAADMMGHAVDLYPGDIEVLHWYAHSIWADSWQDAETILQVILPHRELEGDVLYDLACTRSLAGDLDASEDYLRRAIEAGYREWSHMEIDPDLRNLREAERFGPVLQEYGR